MTRTRPRGSSQQVKDVMNHLTAWGKREKVCLVVICHVAKDGEMAGPKTVEHLCDTILELDPVPRTDEYGIVIEKTKDYVALSSGKNRHGESGLDGHVQPHGDWIGDFAEEV